MEAKIKKKAAAAPAATGEASGAGPVPPPEPPMAERAAAAAAGKEEEKPTQSSGFLDLAFIMDCTGSMGSYIQSAQQNIRGIIEKIVQSESADVQFGLVGYRDHPPQDSTYVTKVFEFTNSLRTMRAKLNSLDADGGGDNPEAVADGMHAALKLAWRKESTKVCVLIADAPPHGLGDGGWDGFPKGCPAGLDPVDIAHTMAAKGITLYVVGVEPPARPYRDFWMALCTITGGQYVPLSNAALLAGVIIGGAQEEMALEQIVREIQDEIEEDDDEDVVATRVHTRMTERGVQLKRLQLGTADLPEATPTALKYSKAKMLSEVRKDFKSDDTMMPSFGGRTKGGKMMRKKKMAAPMSMPMGAGSSAPEAALSAAPVTSMMPMSMQQASRIARKSKARSKFS